MKKRSIAAWTAVAALALGACGKKDETPVAANVAASDGLGNEAVDGLNVATPLASPGQDFANTAAASDAFEIATSQLALANASSAAVKKFAGQMIEAHRQSTAKLTTAAAGASPAIAPDPALTAAQQAKVDALKGKSGKDFDTAYVAEQQAAHQMTLDALRGYSASGDVPALKAFATELTPTVAAHLNMAKALKP